MVKCKRKTRRERQQVEEEEAAQFELPASAKQGLRTSCNGASEAVLPDGVAELRMGGAVGAMLAKSGSVCVSVSKWCSTPQSSKNIFKRDIAQSCVRDVAGPCSTQTFKLVAAQDLGQAGQKMTGCKLRGTVVSAEPQLLFGEAQVVCVLQDAAGACVQVRPLLHSSHYNLRACAWVVRSCHNSRWGGVGWPLLMVCRCGLWCATSSASHCN